MIKVFFASSESSNKFGVNQVILHLKKFLSKNCTFFNPGSFLNFFKNEYDLVHIHGCWKLNILFFFYSIKI